MELAQDDGGLTYKTVVGDTALLGLLPAVVVPVVLVFAGSATLWPAVIAYHALCIGVPLAARQTPSTLGLVGRPAFRSMAESLALCAVLLAAGFAISRTAITAVVPLAWTGLLRRLHPWWAFVAYSMCVNPLLEEVFWRGFLLPYTGPLGGAALFYLMHATALAVLIGPWHATWIALPTFLAGLFWGWTRERTGSVWPCVITHLGADTAILIAAAALR